MFLQLQLFSAFFFDSDFAIASSPAAATVFLRHASFLRQMFRFAFSLFADTPHCFIIIFADAIRCFSLLSLLASEPHAMIAMPMIAMIIEPPPPAADSHFHCHASASCRRQLFRRRCRQPHDYAGAACRRQRLLNERHCTMPPPAAAAAVIDAASR